MSRHARPTCCRLLPEFRTRQAPPGPLPSVAVFAIFFPPSVNISLLFTVHDFVCFPVFPFFPYSLFYSHIVSLLSSFVFHRVGFLFAIYFLFPVQLLMKGPLGSHYCNLSFALFALFG